MKNIGANEVRERLHFEREMMDLELGAKDYSLTRTPIIFIPGGTWL